MPTSNFKFHWVNSVGGPLIVLARQLLPKWDGTIVGKEGQLSDYERACQVTGYLGVISVDSSEALVLGDEPMQTTWINRPGGGILVRWMAAESEDALVEELDRISEEVSPVGETLWKCDGDAILFDATESGSGLSGDKLDIPLEGGIYRVRTIEHAHNRSAQMIVHQLLRQSQKR